MIRPSGGGRGRSLGRVIYDIAQTLESADEPDDRLRRAMVLLRYALPFDVCALLETHSTRPRRLLVEPEAPPEARTELAATLAGLLAERLAERAGEQVGTPVARPSRIGSSLAVPIVGLGEMVGIIYVSRADGTYSERHLRILAIVAGQVAAYLSLVRDYDEARVQARVLDDARRAAIAADRAKDELLAVLSHKLKDPVAATLAWAHILVAARADPSGPALAVVAIERNARSLAKLIDDMQRLPCVASAELRLDLRAGEPVRALKVAIEGPRPLAERPAALLEAAAAPEPDWLDLSPQQLGPVVSSVVASATQVVPPGEHMAVHLDRERPPVTEAAPPVAESGPKQVLAGISVLVVDDDFDIREAFQWVLEHYGARVTVTSSAAEAMAVLELARPDVMLCDLSMPVENGYELMRRVAARDAALPAAALTAFGVLADPERALAAGFRLQLAKPIDVAVLVATILELAGPQRAQRHAGRA